MSIFSAYIRTSVYRAELRSTTRVAWPKPSTSSLPQPNSSPHIATPVFPFLPFRPPPNTSSILVILLHHTIMPGSLENRYIRLEGESFHITFLSVS
ncbi:hypothetical protein BDR03DRAFT_321944 [Suillus americanus]|nr:hypothetical protein BDR03DRAFT_321944 [Suillus americanus]